MPELPEVETVRRTLKNFIIGKEIKEIKVYYDKIIEGDTAVFIQSLTGQRIRDIDRIGKYLIFILEDYAFVSHLRMEGKYHITETSKQLDKHEHISFRFSDKMELRYHDTRKFGRLALVNKETYSQELPLSKLGPEPWEADPEDIYSKIHKSSQPIKTLLLDQTIMTGIGNIYANEICYDMKINPKTPGNCVSKKRIKELIDVSKKILEDAISQGGTTIHSFSVNGISGSFQQQLHVHMQQVCVACGGQITKETVQGRGTYYCKVCQKKRG